MSRQPVRPRAIHEHEAAAHAVFAHYARVAGWAPRLPVPVEQIIERCHGLHICWEPLPEPPGAIDRRLLEIRPWRLAPPPKPEAERPLWLTLVGVYTALTVIVGLVIGLDFFIAWLATGSAI